MFFDRQRIIEGSAFALGWLVTFALLHVVFQLLSFHQDFWRAVFHINPLDAAACVASYRFTKKLHQRFYETQKNLEVR